ncbi:K(+)-transporting ATPase subunit F [Allonocardiopsis opalescens]|uniref:K+-transporting ATPase KdpF subunit n=1 Tax=Allonocardiopsis opalescens TaxID=1144618 RepID=A0A2T0PTE3_9ACTN|nr:K(+)-transporting ATPase subunit F [Allonocardiopsis opalescens]PRX92164.1 K+-transporting ATPase KdpF subunit [Allonocardiopsis opalescens]
MSAPLADIAGLVVALGLAGYLLLALVRPERF